MSDERTKLIAEMFAQAVGESPAPPASPPPASPPPEEFGFDDSLDDVPPPNGTDWALVKECAAEPQNDIGNSRRLRLRHGANLLHVQNIGWHVYDDKRWREDIDAAGTRPVCHQTVEAIALEAYVLEPTDREAADIEAAELARQSRADLKAELSETDDEDVSATARKREQERLRALIRDLDEVIARGAAAKKALAARQAQRRRFANASGNKGKVDGMLAEALAFLSKPVGALDADDLALNVGNGTLHFVEREVPDPECPDPDVVRMRSEWVVEMRPHTRSDLISKLADVEYDPSATCPLFDAFVTRILPSQDVCDFVKRYFGYSTTALTREQCFVLFHGEGRNGKSTLVDIIARILADYSTSLPIDSLVNSGSNKKGSEATPDLARLPGARLVRTAEPKEGSGFDEALIKGLTSSEPIPVRRLNCEFNDIYPTFKLVVSANRKPVIKGNDDGIWRRVHLVPFEVQIPKEEVDKQLSDKMWKERSGILNWLIAGACDYLNRGKLDPPEAVTAATQEYRDESDLVALFVRSACDITKNPSDSEESGRLYQSFEIWCRRNGTTPFAQTTFSRRMPKTAADLGLEKGKSSVAVYIGLRIRPEFAPRFDAPGGPHGYGVGG